MTERDAGQGTVVTITDDCEFESYVASLRSSSDRVRYVLIAVIVASVLLFVGYTNSSYGSWMTSREELAWLTREFQLWEPHLDQKMNRVRQAASQRITAGSEPDAETFLAKVRAAHAWAQQRRFQTDAEVLQWLQDLQTSEVANVLQLTMPFLGLRFDVNDLGVFGGLGLTFLMLLLAFSLSREHENVYLVLWKVRDLCKTENGFDQQGGRANLLYHALAMAQVLSKPPTLARWRPRWSRLATKVLFLIPLLVHSLVFYHDLRGRAMAAAVNRFRTNLNLLIEAGAVLALLFFCFLCVSYSRSNDLRWSYTFFRINPSWRSKPQPRWFRWVRFKATAGESDPENGTDRPAQGSVARGSD